MDDQQEDNNTNNEVDRALPTATIQQTMAPYGLNTGQESFVPRINPATLFQPIPTPAFLTAMQQQAGRHSAPTVPTTTAPATVTTSTTTAAAATIMHSLSQREWQLKEKKQETRRTEDR